MLGGLKEFLKRSSFLVALVGATRGAVQDCRKAGWCLLRSRAINSYLKSYKIRKLQIGAGPNVMGGWLNTDVNPSSREVVFLDATASLVFEDGAFDYIFSEHVIEHLRYADGLSMLRECHRVLKPGGRLRIATPDLEILVGLYTPKKGPVQERYVEWIIDRYLPEVVAYRECFAVNNAFRNFGHQFLYDRATLQGIMEEAGFVNITRYAPGESDDGNLQGLEYHGKAVGDEEMNRFETMVLEARRLV